MEDIGKYTLEQAGVLIKLARQSIKSKFTNQEVEFPQEAVFKQQRGVFVTLHTYPDNKLRGCIGFPTPKYSISEAVSKAAQAAAFSDPRFSQLKQEELDNIVIEISILTIPQQTDVKDIEIGKHGLICEYLFYSGLLLPQVAVENNFSKIQFLECLCNKAGIPKDSWQQEKFKLYKFQAQIFSEEKPGGEVVEKQ